MRSTLDDSSVLPVNLFSHYKDWYSRIWVIVASSVDLACCVASKLDPRLTFTSFYHCSLILTISRRSIITPITVWRSQSTAAPTLITASYVPRAQVRHTQTFGNNYVNMISSCYCIHYKWSLHIFRVFIQKTIWQLETQKTAIFFPLALPFPNSSWLSERDNNFLNNHLPFFAN